MDTEDPDFNGYSPDRPGPDDESRYACPRLVHNPLHLPWEAGFPDVGAVGFTHDTLARPAFFRTQSMPTGINSAARYVVGEESTACPYCRQRFRNPNALKLHVEQSHAAEFEWMLAEPERVVTAKEQAAYDKLAADRELSPKEQAAMDERIAKATQKIREKFLEDLLSGVFDYTEFL